MEYNTTRNKLAMREYGRHVQKMVEHVQDIEDPERRQKNAQAVIDLMGILNPHLNLVEDFKHKLWDHLYVIANFDLDIKSPYPTPTIEKYKEKPKPLPYPNRSSKLSHLGKNLESIIEIALEETNPEKKEGFANAIAYYMKLAYNNWHKEEVQDDVIQSELNAITGGALTFTNTPYVKAYRMENSRDRNNNPKRGKFQPQRGSNNANNNNNKRRNDNIGKPNNNYKKKRF